MQTQFIVLDQSEIISPLGTLSEAAADLIDGAGAAMPGPCFGVNASHADFPDKLCRSLTFAAKALKTSIDLREVDPASTVFLFCAAKGDIGSLENHFFPDSSATSPISPLLDVQAKHVQTMLMPDCRRTIVVSNACASGAIGVEIAKDLLETGAFKHALLFGLDVLSRFVVTGFASLGALSPNGARPFDQERDGLTLGEGACVALLTKRAAFEGDVVITGAASAGDANHRTGPSRTGDGLYRAAHAALADAGISPSDIGAVKCHGTGTRYNDAMEAKALSLLFKDAFPPCCSIKGAIGHASGAGSLLEMLIAAQFLTRHMLAPTVGFSSLGVDEAIPITSEPQAFEKNSLLCLSAGFGGINAATLLKEILP
jgi:3-oxoacyl-[acyl-carrier-protein] synthase-1